MATTTNFGWTTPNDTDLVKDGAAAIRTLGSAIDTSMMDLKGGTTGQMLVKNTNTDMDFVWQTPQIGDITEVAAGTGISGGGTSGSVTITNSMATAIDAKGDLVAGTGADAFARLAVGANNTVLTADSTTATGLKWSAINVKDKFVTGAASNLNGSSTVTISLGATTYNKILLFIQSASPGTASTTVSIRLNTDTGANYAYVSNQLGSPSTYSSSYMTTTRNISGDTSIPIGKFSSNAASVMDAAVMIEGAASTGSSPIVRSHSSVTQGGGNDGEARWVSGYWAGGVAITSVSVIVSSGTFDAGSIFIAGAE